MRIKTLLLALPFVAAAPLAGLAASCPATKPPAPLDASSPGNLGVLKLSILEYKCSGKMESDIESVLSEAKMYVEAREKQVSKPAIVLDIDETSLSNWEEILADDFGYIPDGPCDLSPNYACGFKEWELSARASVIAPTLELYRTAKGDNVAIFFVTGRHENPGERKATEKNLRDAGYYDWAGLIMRPEGTTASIADFKTIARANISGLGFVVIANVGDQLSDLAGGYSERVFKVPNPFYFIP